MAIEKERVDVLAVQQGLFTSREQAKRAIMAGEILGENEQRMDKAGEKIPVTTELHLKGAPMPYVSQDGLGYWVINRWLYRCVIAKRG